MTAALEGGEWSAARPGRTLPPGKDTVPIVQEAGWASGPVWTGGKSHPHRDSIPDRPARSQSLYWLSYPAHIHVSISCIFHFLFYKDFSEGDMKTETCRILRGERKNGPFLLYTAMLIYFNTFLYFVLLWLASEYCIYTNFLIFEGWVLGPLVFPLGD
jgi:hypothetical protein